MEEQKKYCFVCGKELTGHQTKFCSKKMYGIGKTRIQNMYCVWENI